MLSGFDVVITLSGIQSLDTHCVPSLGGDVARACKLKHDNAKPLASTLETESARLKVRIAELEADGVAPWVAELELAAIIMGRVMVLGGDGA